MTPYKDKEKQKAAMREILKRQRQERLLALQFIQDKGLALEFSEYKKSKLN